MHDFGVVCHVSQHLHGRITCTAVALMVSQPTQGHLFTSTSQQTHSVSKVLCFAPVGRFGGVLLGPARFTHINNAARQLLEAQGFIQRGGKAPSARRRAAR